MINLEEMIAKPKSLMKPFGTRKLISIQLEKPSTTSIKYFPKTSDH